MDDSRSFENKLDRDFLFYLNLLRGLFQNLQNETDRNLCELWLTFLVGKKYVSTPEKCDRNIYLSRLVLQMQAGKLKGVFEDSPPTGELVPAFQIFGLPAEVEGLKDFEDSGFQIDQNFGGGGDFFESSRDGRTYLATKKIPQGIMAFLAVTNNEGDPIWIPQLDGVVNLSSASEQPSNIDWPKMGFVKALAKFVHAPLSKIRQAPEQIDQVLEWFDKLISDCNKWIQGEDPHNAELENLFEKLYNDYKLDPDKAEILNHPRKVRTILIKEIREQLEERREQVATRQLILDQLEGEQYVEIFQLQRDQIDALWMQAAAKPMTDYVKGLLFETYPKELVQRFLELLYQERLELISQAECEARKMLRADKEDVVYFLTCELCKLRRVQNEYNEWYNVFKDIERKYDEFESVMREKCGREGQEGTNFDEKLKFQIETELDQAKKKYERERRIQSELTAKLVEVKACLNKIQERVADEDKKMCFDMNEMTLFKAELEEKRASLRRKRDEIRRNLQMGGFRRCPPNSN